MKQIIKSLLIGGALVAASASQAAIVNINVFEDAPTAEALFLSTLHNYTTETFEDPAYAVNPQTLGTNQQLKWEGTAVSFATEVGTFTLVTPGITDINDDERSGELKIESEATGEYGREVASGRWLDSNDARNVTWDIDIGANFNAIGFYLLDAADQGGKLKLTLSNGLVQEYTFNTAQPNANQKYITIVSDVSVASATLTFSQNHGRDGFGIDNVSVGTVPEPGTLLLMGLGLLGLGAARRRNAA